RCGLHVTLRVSSHSSSSSVAVRATMLPYTTPFRSWCMAFVRRHNDLGDMCVVVRRGDPIAGQVFIEVDHLDGTRPLYTPAPTLRDQKSTRLNSSHVKSSYAGCCVEQKKRDPRNPDT